MVEQLHLDGKAPPHYLPLLGKHFAGKYGSDTLAPAKWGFSHYAWGGEQVDITELSLPDHLIGKKLTLIKTSSDGYQLIGPKGNVLLSGEFNQLAHNYKKGILVDVKNITARVGESFTVVEKDPAAVILDLSKR